MLTVSYPTSSLPFHTPKQCPVYFHTCSRPPHRRESVPYLSLWIWFLLLSMVTCISVHSPARNKLLFLLRVKYDVILYTYHVFFFCAAIDGHLRQFQDLTSVNTEGINTGVVGGGCDLWSSLYFVAHRICALKSLLVQMFTS